MARWLKGASTETVQGQRHGGARGTEYRDSDINWAFFSSLYIIIIIKLGLVKIVTCWLVNVELRLNILLEI